MALQYGVTLRDNQLDQIEATLGVSPRLRIYSGLPPADCAAAATGTMLIDMTLPVDWMNAAAGGTKTQLGTWSMTGDAAASSGTNATYFRIWDSAVAVCSVQGSITHTTGGGDMKLDNISIAVAQTLSVTSFTVTAGNT